MKRGVSARDLAVTRRPGHVCTLPFGSPNRLTQRRFTFKATKTGGRKN